MGMGPREGLVIALLIYVKFSQAKCTFSPLCDMWPMFSKIELGYILYRFLLLLTILVAIAMKI